MIFPLFQSFTPRIWFSLFSHGIWSGICWNTGSIAGLYLGFPRSFPGFGRQKWKFTVLKALFEWRFRFWVSRKGSLKLSNVYLKWNRWVFRSKWQGLVWRKCSFRFEVMEICSWIGQEWIRCFIQKDLIESIPLHFPH